MADEVAHAVVVVVEDLVVPCMADDAVVADVVAQMAVVVTPMAVVDVTQEAVAVTSIAVVVAQTAVVDGVILAAAAAGRSVMGQIVRAES